MASTPHTRELCSGKVCFYVQVFLVGISWLRAASAAPEPTFGAPLDSPVPGSPWGSVVGDFTGDGNLDVIVATPAMLLLPGNGDGTFASGIALGLTNNGFTAVTGDFNVDGRLDFVVVAFNDVESKAAVLLGNGDGTFALSTNVSLGGSPSGLESADFNGDGLPDVAVANQGGVQMLLNDGGVGFTLAKTNNLVSSPQSLGAADFNGDGKQDLVVSSSSSMFTVLLGLGDGAFVFSTNRPASYDFSGVVTGDFNHDGWPDFVASRWYLASTAVFLNQGFGVFGEPTYTNALPLGPLGTVDVNGDGHLDLVQVKRPGTNVINVLAGHGDGRFLTALQLPLEAEREFRKTADFDNDGRPDLLCTSGNGLSVLLNRTRPALSATLLEGSMRLVWPPWPAFALEESLDLGFGEHWARLTNTPAAVDGQFALTFVPGSTNCFYRLRSQ